VAPGVILQVLRREAPEAAAAAPSEEPGRQVLRLGFTASRKVGIAVLRNRARRRLRAAAAAIMPVHAAPGHDYVLIARAGTVTRPYAALVEDLCTGLRRLGVYRDGAAKGGNA